jgi:ABC-2 type transport system permease protein
VSVARASRSPTTVPGRNAFVYRPTASPQAAAQWTPRQVAMTNLRTVLGRAYPRVTGLFREKSWVFFEILLPFLSTSAFVFVYRALQAPPQYVGFVVLGGAMTAFWLNVIWMLAQQLWWE